MDSVDTDCTSFKRMSSPPSLIPCFDSTENLALEIFNDYRSRPVDDKPFVAEDTIKERDRVWEKWTVFCSRVHIDAYTPWPTFLSTPHTAEAQAPFKAFLRHYVETTTQMIIVLGSEEYKKDHTIKSAFSLTEIWRRLVASAEHYVLRELRKNDPDFAQSLKLRWISKEEGSKEGPTYRIVQWIFTELAIEIGLVVVPTYEKTEMTPSDVYVVLKTLWARAEDIPCTPTIRVSFHGVILLSAIGGFRPGTLQELSYEQFSVAVIRDLEDLTQTRIVISVCILRNKVKKRSTTSRPKAGTWIRFDITLVPNSTLCLGSLVLSRALQDNAFESSFSSIDQIFDRPRLESVDFIPLKWKESIREKKIFPIKYETTNKLWHRTLLVAGFRMHSRMYSLRVGAGSRLDGVLSDALRNYVMSHTSSVFEASYQTARVRENLMSLAFSKDVARDEKLFEKLRDMSLSRDPGAPVNITKDEVAQFEQRKDITKWRAEIECTEDATLKGRLKGKIYSTIQRLSQLQLEKSRVEYFDRVDDLRARGIATTHTAEPIKESNTGTGRLTAKVAKLLNVSSSVKVLNQTVRTREYIQTLLGCLIRAPGDDEDDPGPEKHEDSDIKSQRACCFLCRKDWAQRSSLTRHYQETHIPNKTFSQPLNCPECTRLGLGEVVVTGMTEWCNHLERCHGKIHTPNLASKDLVKSEFPCCICKSESSSKNRLIEHLSRHMQEIIGGQKPSCKLCTGASQVTLENPGKALSHFKEHYSLPIVYCLLCGRLCLTASGLTRHITNAHQNDFQEPFACPACEGETKDGLSYIDGVVSWQKHQVMHPESGYEGSRLLETQKREIRQSKHLDSMTKATIAEPPLHMKFVDTLQLQEGAHSCKVSEADPEIPTPPCLQVGESVQRTLPTWSSSQETLYVSPVTDFHMTGRGDVRIGEALAESTQDDNNTAMMEGVVYDTLHTSADGGNGWCESVEEVTTCCSDVGVDGETKYSGGSNSSDSDDVYTLDCILERLGRNTFLVRWADRSCTWEPRKNLLDAELVQQFEAEYRGLRQGISILATRKRKGKTEYRVRWQGRPIVEDNWVKESTLHPDLVEKHKPKPYQRGHRGRRIGQRC